MHLHDHALVVLVTRRRGHLIAPHRKDLDVQPRERASGRGPAWDASSRVALDEAHVQRHALRPQRRLQQPLRAHRSEWSQRKRGATRPRATSRCRAAANKEVSGQGGARLEPREVGPLLCLQLREEQQLLPLLCRAAARRAASPTAPARPRAEASCRAPRAEQPRGAPPAPAARRTMKYLKDNYKHTTFHCIDARRGFPVRGVTLEPFRLAAPRGRGGRHAARPEKGRRGGVQ